MMLHSPHISQCQQVFTLARSCISSQLMMMNRRWELRVLGEPLVRTEAAIPEAPATGYVIKVRFCGICHYDVESCAALGPGQELPKVLGHEISGVIHACGDLAQNERPELSLGDAVVVFPWAFCGKCPDCVADNSAFCRGDPPLLTQGFYIDGGYQDYVVVHRAEQLFKVPDGVPLDVAAVSACSALTGYGLALQLNDSIERALRIKEKASVLLVGVGGVSLWAIQFLRHIWQDKDVKIYAVSTKKEKADAGLSAGADVTITWSKDGSDEDAIAKVKAECGTFDAVVDCVGTNHTAGRIFPLLNTCATWVLVGTFGGTLPPVPLVGVVMGGVRIQGSMIGSRGQFAVVIDMLKKAKVTPPPISHVAMDDVNDALGRLLRGEIIGRATITMQ